MKKKKIILGIAAVLGVGITAYQLVKGSKAAQGDHPLEGRFIKSVSHDPIFKVVNGEPVHVQNPAQMDALMVQKYGVAHPWRYDAMLLDEILGYFPELAKFLNESTRAIGA